jgi:hypothetical protein
MATTGWANLGPSTRGENGVAEVAGVAVISMIVHILNTQMK